MYPRDDSVVDSLLASCQELDEQEAAVDLIGGVAVKTECLSPSTDAGDMRAPELTPRRSERTRAREGRNSGTSARGARNEAGSEGAKESKEERTRARKSVEGTRKRSRKDGNKENLKTDSKRRRAEARPNVVMEKIGDEMLPGEMGDDETFLYVSQEMFTKMINNANNSEDNGDVFLSCQEVETQHGRMLMMTSDKVAGEEVVEAAGTHHPPKPQSKLASAFQDVVQTDAIGSLFQESGQTPLHHPQLGFTGDQTTAAFGSLEPLHKNVLTGRNKVYDPETNHCLICDTSFEDMASLRLHFTFYHSQKNNTMLRCWECKLCFKTAQDYMEHKMGEHAGRENVCTICGELLATSRSLQRHLNNHLSVNKYKCDTCNRVFRNRQSREDHVKSKHRLSVPMIMCQQCGTDFKHARSLRRHISTVHAKQRVTCSTCNKSYSSISSLYYHQRTIHEKVAFHCGYCSKAFKSVSAIKKHESIMHHEISKCRDSPTEKIYSYNQYVSPTLAKRAKKNSTLHIQCMFCKAEYLDHASYAKHYNKFHRDENSDIMVESAQVGAALQSQSSSFDWENPEDKLGIVGQGSMEEAVLDNLGRGSVEGSYVERMADKMSNAVDLSKVAGLENMGNHQEPYHMVLQSTEDHPENADVCPESADNHPDNADLGPETTEDHPNNADVEGPESADNHPDNENVGPEIVEGQLRRLEEVLEEVLINPENII